MSVGTRMVVVSRCLSCVKAPFSGRVVSIVVQPEKLRGDWTVRAFVSPAFILDRTSFEEDRLIGTLEGYSAARSVEL